MTLEEMQQVIGECEFPHYTLEVAIDGRGAIYLRAAYMEADVATGKEELQQTRRWFLSPEMTRSELVQTAFKCVLTSAEHRVREWFRYRGRAVFGPHFNVEALWAICEVREVRL